MGLGTSRGFALAMGLGTSRGFALAMGLGTSRGFALAMGLGTSRSFALAMGLGTSRGFVNAAEEISASYPIARIVRDLLLAHLLPHGFNTLFKELTD